jgi:hypothetical protein
MLANVHRREKKNCMSLLCKEIFLYGRKETSLVRDSKFHKKNNPFLFITYFDVCEALVTRDDIV